MPFFFLQDQLFCHILWRHRVIKRELLGLLLPLKWHSRLWLNVLQVNKLEKYWKEDASFERRLPNTSGVNSNNCFFRL